MPYRDAGVRRPRRAARRSQTPGVETIEALAEFLGIDPRATAKAMLVVADGRQGAWCSRSCAATAGCTTSSCARRSAQAHRPATPEEIGAAFGAEPGSIGPVGIDGGARARRSWSTRRSREGAYVAGANRTGYHLTGLVLGRDYQARASPTSARVEAGDGCPRARRHPAHRAGDRGRQHLQARHEATRTRSARRTSTRAGKEQPIVMGSYGIGPARIVAAAVEQSHDERGCIWPAPRSRRSTPGSCRSATRRSAPATARGRAASSAGSTVMIDDRDAVAGRRSFADADLVGVPLRVTIGKRTIAEGRSTCALRRDGSRRRCPVERPPRASPSSSKGLGRE